MSLTFFQFLFLLILLLMLFSRETNFLSQVSKFLQVLFKSMKQMSNNKK